MVQRRRCVESPCASRGTRSPSRWTFVAVRISAFLLSSTVAAFGGGRTPQDGCRSLRLLSRAAVGGAVLSVFAGDGRPASDGGTRRRDGSSERVRGVLQLDTWSGISAAHGRGGMAGIPRVAGSIRPNFFHSVGLVDAKVGRLRTSRRNVGLTGGRLAMRLEVFVGMVVLTVRMASDGHGGKE